MQARLAMIERSGYEILLPFLRPIEHLILDENISEIMVNGGSRVFIERAGQLESVPNVSLSQATLNAAVKNIARRLGDDVSEIKPILDSRLPDVSHLTAIMPPSHIPAIPTT